MLNINDELSATKRSYRTKQHEPRQRKEHATYYRECAERGANVLLMRTEIRTDVTDQYMLHTRPLPKEAIARIERAGE